MTSFYPGSQISGNPAFNPTSQPSYEQGAGTPGLISNLRLWLDAADEQSVIKDGSNEVSQWTDKSSVSDADATQGTGTQQPTWTVNQLNSRPVTNYDGGDRLLIPTALNDIPNGPNTLFMVMRQATASGNTERAFVLAEVGSARLYMEYTTTGGQIGYASNTGTGSVLATGQTTTDFNIIRGRRSGTLMNIAINGGTEFTSVGGADEPGITQGTVGAQNSGGGNDLVGDIAEIILYDRLLSTAEISQVENYLSAKWGIALA